METGEEENIIWEDESVEEDIIEDESTAIHVSLGNVEETEKKKAINRTNFKREDFDQSLIRHTADLQAIFAKTGNYVRIYNKLFKALLDICPILTETVTGTVDAVVTILKWFKASFVIVPDSDATDDEGLIGSAPEELLSLVLKNMCGTGAQISQLCLFALISLNMRARLVRTVDPISLLPAFHDDLVTMRSKEGKGKLRTNQSDAVTPLVWLEVLPSVSGAAIAQKSEVEDSKWIYVNVTHQRLDCKEYVEDELRKKGKRLIPLQYVLAFEPILPSCEFKQQLHLNNDGNSGDEDSNFVRISDVTSSYKKRFSHMTGKEKQQWARAKTWLDAHLRQWNEEGAEEVAEKRRRRTVQQTQQHKKSVAVDYLTTRKETAAVWDLTADDSPLSASDRAAASSSSSHSASSTSARKEQPGILTSPADDAEDSYKQYPIPDKLIDFKDHPVYLLKRFLLPNQTLHPQGVKKMVGLFRGEPVYLQKHKETLRSKLQWRKLGKQVRDGETPVRVVPNTSSSSSSSSSSSATDSVALIDKNVDGVTTGGMKRKLEATAAEESGEGSNGRTIGIDIGMFGAWQVEPLQIPPVVDGILPANKHGNIEIWDGNTVYVPPGARFLPFRGGTARSLSASSNALIRACNSLMLPYLPAVIGFEKRNNTFHVPLYGGLVVLQEHAGLLEDAADYLGACKEEELYLKHKREINKKWRRLISSALLRNELHEKYGH